MNIKERIIEFLKKSENTKFYGMPSDVFSQEELSKYSIWRLYVRITNTVTGHSDLDRYDNYGGMWGNRKIFIVGEKPAKPSPLSRTYPFCGIDGSSKWLNNLLDQENFSEDELIFVNAFHYDNSPNDPWPIKEVEPKIVIALGNKAEEWCKENGIECVKTFHPQYWKRFKSKERYPLLDLIKQNIS